MAKRPVKKKSSAKKTASAPRKSRRTVTLSTELVERRNLPELTRVAIFDDSPEALDRYRDHFQAHNVRLWTYRGSHLTVQVALQLAEFSPQLVIVDLLIGDDRQDGYKLITQIGRLSDLEGVPIVVCSKLINLSHHGRTERAFCLSEFRKFGVVDAIGKIPDLPPVEQILACAGVRR